MPTAALTEIHRKHKQNDITFNKSEKLKYICTFYFTVSKGVLL